MISVRLLAVIGKFFSMALALATSLLVVNWLSPELQGYYYTFASLGALQAFFDLGLGVIIVSHCSQEWAGLNLKEGRLIYTRYSEIQKLGGLIGFFMRWYAVSSAVLALAFLVLGTLFFGYADVQPEIDWLYPWVVLSAGSGMTLYLNSILTILEGCNQLRWVYSLKIFQLFMSNLIIWVLLYSGHELWSIGISLIISSTVIALIIFYKFRSFFYEILNIEKVKIKWKEEIFPMQWRLSISWLSGYLAFSLFVPVLFKFKGPVVAGQMGFSWNFIGAITGFTFAFLAVRTPGLGIEIARNNVLKIKKIMQSLILESIIISVLMSLSILGLLELIKFMEWNIGSRFLPLNVFLYFIGAAILICMSFPFSIFMRAHKVEPGIWVSLSQGVLVSIAILVVGRLYSLELLAQIYFLIMLISLPVTFYIYKQKNNSWYE